MRATATPLSDYERVGAFRVYLLAAWGVIGLLSTGEVSIVACLLALLSMPFAWRRQVRGLPVHAWFWNTLTVLAMGVTFLLYQSSSLDSVILFFLFLQVAKLFTYRSLSDASWIVLVSLFHLVATSVSTASLLFLPVFLIHLVLAAMVLAALAMVRGVVEARQAPREVPSSRALALTWQTAPDRTRLAPAGGAYPAISGFNRWMGLLCLVIAAFAMVIFPVIPRLSTQRLFDNFSPSPPSGAISDFGEEIEFGQYQEIGLSNEVAMYAAPRDPDRRGDHVRLRGVAVDTFDGTRWRRSTQPVTMVGGVSYSDMLRRQPGDVAEWTIRIQPGRVSHLFAPSFPISLKLDSNQSVLYDDSSGSAQLPGAIGKLFTYTVQSRLDLPSSRRDPGTNIDTMLFPVAGRRQTGVASSTVSPPSDLRDSGGPDSGVLPAAPRPLPGADNSINPAFPRPISERNYVLTCLVVPDQLNTSQLLRLAQEWTEGTNNNPFLMARALERRFQETFQYSLVQKSQGNFIEDFLLRTRSGHCEYFATSMAVLLRLLQVPTRVANGYYSAEWSEANQTYVVRQKDAHAWVEVYLGDAVGWMTFDPTPPAGISRTVSESRLARAWRELAETLRLKWYRNVIDFSIQDQTAVRQALFSPEGAVARVSGWFRGGPGESWQRQIFNSVPGGMVGAVLVMAGLAVLVIAYRDSLRDFVARRQMQIDSRRTTVKFYEDILGRLARLGLRRRPDETPREFAARAAARFDFLKPLPVITETYYAVRFTGRQPAPAEMEQALEFAREVRRLGRLQETSSGVARQQ